MCCCLRWGESQASDQKQSHRCRTQLGAEKDCRRWRAGSAERLASLSHLPWNEECLQVVFVNVCKWYLPDKAGLGQHARMFPLENLAIITLALFKVAIQPPLWQFQNQGFSAYRSDSFPQIGRTGAGSLNRKHVISANQTCGGISSFIVKFRGSGYLLLSASRTSD